MKNKKEVNGNFTMCFRHSSKDDKYQKEIHSYVLDQLCENFNITNVKFRELEYNEFTSCTEIKISNINQEHIGLLHRFTKDIQTQFLECGSHNYPKSRFWNSDTKMKEFIYENKKSFYRTIYKYKELIEEIDTDTTLTDDDINNRIHFIKVNMGYCLFEGNTEEYLKLKIELDMIKKTYNK